MQIVIEIPEEDYNFVKKQVADGIFNPLKVCIANGIPLPKGHGRLIDGDRFDVISYQHTSDDFDNGVMWLAEQIDDAPTIIEADKAESEGTE